MPGRIQHLPSHCWIMLWPCSNATLGLPLSNLAAFDIGSSFKQLCPEALRQGRLYLLTWLLPPQANDVHSLHVRTAAALCM